MKDLRLLLALYWKLTLNNSRRTAAAFSRLGFTVLIVIFSFFAGLSFGLSLEILHGDNNEAPWVDRCSQLLGVLFAAVVLGRLFSPAGYLTIPGMYKLRSFPLSQPLVVFSYVCCKFVDQWSIIFLNILLGFMTALGVLFSVESFVLSFLLGTGLTIVLYLLSETLRGLISSVLMRQKGVVELAFLALLGILSYQLVFQNFLSTRQALSFLPTTVSIALYQLTVLHDTSMGWNQVGMLVAAAVMLLFSSMLSIMLYERMSTYPRNRVRSSLKFSSLVGLVSRICPVEIGSYSFKDTLYLFRTSRVRLAMITELIFYAIIAFQLSDNTKITQHSYVGIFLFTSIPVLLWDYYLSNSFGVDRQGFSFYLVAPISLSKVIISKNLSFIFWRLPILVLSWIIFSSLFSPSHLTLLILVQWISLALLLITGNINSILAPTPVARREGLGSSITPTSTFSWIGFLGLTMNFLVPAIISVCIWLLPLWLLYAILVAILSGVWIVYLLSVSFLVEIFNERAELILLKLKNA